ncbi:unnamed protein product [Gongylonema pulchrum]|uniref:PHD-type domain-containing protein n=1 Tax=Gongylonema pulchrum TaxID=637853 RepID=A0A183DBJ9_9BILA|nr:unnamed protein product [Gongylonema pulchrum]
MSETTEQHLMALCDYCHKHYHLACLTPPLRKVPKKTKKLTWMCANCTHSSDSDKAKVKFYL